MPLDGRHMEGQVYTEPTIFQELEEALWSGQGSSQENGK